MCEHACMTVPDAWVGQGSGPPPAPIFLKDFKQQIVVLPPSSRAPPAPIISERFQTPNSGHITYSRPPPQIFRKGSPLMPSNVSNSHGSDFKNECLHVLFHTIFEIRHIPDCIYDPRL